MAHFDHLVVAVPNLSSAIERWSVAGLPVKFGGEHPGGTRNALIRGNEPAYVELISAPVGAHNEWSERVRNTPGPLSFAVAVPDIDAARAALRRADFNPQRVRSGARMTPSGQELSWRLCDVGTGPFDSELPFLIQWVSPLPPRPANEFAVRSVTVRVPDPNRLRKLLSVVGFEDKRVRLRIEAGDGGPAAATFALKNGVHVGEHHLDGLKVAITAFP